MRVSLMIEGQEGVSWDEWVALARALKELGVDLVDTSSGGLVPTAQVPVGPGYQTAFAERIRREAGLGPVRIPVADAMRPVPDVMALRDAHTAAWESTAPIAMVQSFYPLAERVARARGRDPDRPPHLSKVTETI